ncbi:ETS-like protein pointed isoform X2 [Vespula squamosa]|uniref:ETS-like protein pointed isoform X2 n=1 Tax=Vespula squamosa TaxID=30214 RepID=A0ABD1ZU48_VESSQ
MERERSQRSLKIEGQQHKGRVTAATGGGGRSSTSVLEENDDNNDYDDEDDDDDDDDDDERCMQKIWLHDAGRDAISGGLGVGGFLGGGSISDGGGMLMVMAKLMKQELASDAEEEGLVPALPGRFTSMRKVPSLSDLSDPESSLVTFKLVRYLFLERNLASASVTKGDLATGCDVRRRHATTRFIHERQQASEQASKRASKQQQQQQQDSRHTGVFPCESRLIT